jgi:hypothetical protein
MWGGINEIENLNAQIDKLSQKIRDIQNQRQQRINDEYLRLLKKIIPIPSLFTKSIVPNGYEESRSWCK